MATAKETQSISQQASVAPEAARQKRGLRMSWFADKADHLKVGLAFEQGDSKGDVEKCALVCGQVVGVIYDVEERTFATNDGEVATSLVAVGDFEAAKYSTGEVVSVTSMGLPKYYLEAARAALGKSQSEAMMFAIEVALVPTGKQVPTAWEIKNLIPREVNSPINELKRRLASAGRLRLPPPTSAPTLLADKSDAPPASEPEGE